MESLDPKAIVSFGGGARGIAKAIIKEFTQQGYEPFLFHRRGEETENVSDQKQFYLDVDDTKSLWDSIGMIKRLMETNYTEIIIIFPTGGSMRDQYKKREIQVEAIMRHNYMIPTLVTDLMNTEKKEKKRTCKLKTVYLSSAASMHLKGESHYCAAKAALETYFKAMFRDEGTCIEMYLYRLGLVDIEHKYFHQLAIKKPVEFKKFMEQNIPSGYFTKPEEVARIIRTTMLDSMACNGIICDISGGNSWM